MRVAVVIPWRGGDTHRARSFEFVKRHLALVATYDMCMFIVDSGHARFHRGASRNLGVDLALEAACDVAVVCDADTVPDYLALAAAIDGALEDGLLHLPYRRYRALTATGSRRYMRGADPLRCQAELDWEASTGGVLVIRPQRWRDAGGMDERFTCWGYEDTSFRIACDALLGPTVRHEGMIVHLWHPSTQDRGTPERDLGHRLALRYDAAEGDPDAVRALLQEAGGYPLPEKPGDTP